MATTTYVRHKSEYIKKNVVFYGFKDQVIFEKSEVVKDDGSPYVVFTPYSKKWKENLKKNEFNKITSFIFWAIYYFK